jgi:hypothetical protein
VAKRRRFYPLISTRFSHKWQSDEGEGEFLRRLFSGKLWRLGYDALRSRDGRRVCLTWSSQATAWTKRDASSSASRQPQ